MTHLLHFYIFKFPVCGQRRSTLCCPLSREFLILPKKTARPTRYVHCGETDSCDSHGWKYIKITVVLLPFIITNCEEKILNIIYPIQ